MFDIRNVTNMANAFFAFEVKQQVRCLHNSLRNGNGEKPFVSVETPTCCGSRRVAFEVSLFFC